MKNVTPTDKLEHRLERLLNKVTCSKTLLMLAGYVLLFRGLVAVIFDIVDIFLK